MVVDRRATDGPQSGCESPTSRYQDYDSKRVVRRADDYVGGGLRQLAVARVPLLQTFICRDLLAEDVNTGARNTRIPAQVDTDRSAQVSIALEAP